MPTTPSDHHPTVERDGRIYLAPTSSVPTVWTLAVDELSRESFDKVHDILKVVDANFDGPVEEALTEGSERVKCVVDLGCGSGKWIREMAEQFPQVQFTGVDVVPPSNEGMPPNVKFNYCNVIEGTSFADNTFDIVHARIMLRAILDFPALLVEVARILRPGGLFLSGEFSWYFHLDLPHPVPLSVYVPAFTRWVNGNANTIRNTGTTTIAEAVTMRVRASGLFEDDVSVVHTLPIGEHQLEEGQEEIGKVMSDWTMGIVTTSRWRLKEVGWTDEQYSELLANIKEEFRTKPGILGSYYMTHARKI